MNKLLKRRSNAWLDHGTGKVAFILFQFDLTLLSISFSRSKIETISISHRNKVFSYCLKLLNIS